MPSLRHLVLYLHVLAAIFWIGQMLVLALVVGPYARTLDSESRKALFHAIGRRSLPLVWSAVGILLVTGVGNVLLLNVRLGELFTAEFYATQWGRTLGFKLKFVALMLVISVWHDFIINRKARAAMADAPTRADGEAPAHTPQYIRYRKQAMLLGRLNFLVGLVVIYFATQLVAGP